VALQLKTDSAEGFWKFYEPKIPSAIAKSVQQVNIMATAISSQKQNEIIDEKPKNKMT
jgi:hypothetical protein